MIKKLHLHHGSLFTISKNLKSNGKKAIKKPIKYTRKQILDGNIDDHIGSLGYGFYTFLDDYKLSYDFEKKFIHEAHDRVVVFELDVEVSEDNLLVLDGENYDSKQFRKWLALPEIQKSIKFYKEKRKINNTGKQNSLDGILIELYCSLLAEVWGTKIEVVKAPTHTSIDGMKVSGIMNGIEVLIKDPEVIVDGTFKEYKLEEKTHG